MSLSTLDLMFLETSALTGVGIQDIYLKCTRTILTKIEQGILNPDVAGSGVQRGDAGQPKETIERKPQPDEGGCC